MRVKVDGAPPKNPPNPVAKADIQGQGSIPYGVSKDEFGEEFFTLIGDILVHIIDTQDEEIDDEEEEEPV